MDFRQSWNYRKLENFEIQKSKGCFCDGYCGILLENPVAPYENIVKETVFVAKHILSHIFFKIMGKQPYNFKNLEKFPPIFEFHFIFLYFTEEICRN
jgi:hypothetical protein